MPIEPVMLAQLRENNEVIKDVWLSNAELKDADVVALVEVLSNNTVVTYLNLSGNAFGDAGVQAIARLLRVNTSIKKIRLSSNNLDYVHARWLADALIENHCLQELALSHNRIGDMGVSALCELLNKNKVLRYLGMDEVGVSDAGALVLSRCLQTNPALEALTLEANCMTDVGVGHLALALQHNTKLQSLGLSYNRMGDDGAHALGEALRVNRHLKALDLMFCHLSAAQLAPLAAGLTVNTGLRQIGLFGQNLGKAGEKIFADVIKVNRTLATIMLEEISDAGDDLLTAAVLGEVPEKRNYQVEAFSASQNTPPRLSAVLLKNRRLSNLLSLIRWAWSWEGKNKPCKPSDRPEFIQDVMAWTLPVSDQVDADTYNFLSVELLKALYNFRFENLYSERASFNAYLMDKHYSNTKMFFESLKTMMDTMIDPAFQACLPPTHRFNQIIQEIAIVSVVKAAQLVSVDDYDLAKMKECENDILKNLYLNYFVPDAWRAFMPDLISSIILFRCAQAVSPSEQAIKIIDTITAMLCLTGLTYDDLPETHYLQEFKRLLTATVDRFHLEDVDAQMNALLCMAQPYCDASLQKEADFLLLGYFYFEMHAPQWYYHEVKRAFDLLVLALCAERINENISRLDYLKPTIAPIYERLVNEEMVFDFQLLDELKDNKAFSEAINNYFEIYSGLSELSLALLMQKWRATLIKTAAATQANPNCFFTTPPAIAQLQNTANELTTKRRA